MSQKEPLISPSKASRDKEKDMKVKVALRIRPLISRDMTEDCQIIVECNPAEKYVSFKLLNIGYRCKHFLY